MNPQQIINRWTSIARSHHRLRPSRSPIALNGSRTRLQRIHQTHHTRSIDASPSEPSAIDHERERGPEEAHTSATSFKPTPSALYPATEHSPTPAAAPDQPWFVDDEPVGSSQGAADEEDLGVDLTPTGPPPPAPTNLPADLEDLYSHLVSSPFFDPPSLSFIDAKKSPLGDAAWTDWVVLVTLKRGRERAIRGAAESIQSILEGKMSVRLEGTDSTSSSSTWAMVDGGKVVIHILTEQSRQLYDLESVWKAPTSSSRHANQNYEKDYY